MKTTKENLETTVENTESQESSVEERVEDESVVSTRSQELEDAQVVAKKFCTECGKEVPAEAKFCPFCGNKLM